MAKTKKPLLGKGTSDEIRNMGNGNFFKMLYNNSYLYLIYL